MEDPGSPLTPPSGEHPPPLAPSRQGVLWLQVASLAGVQAAITLSWVIYGSYLPQLLNKFGFPAAFATSVLIVENALAAVMEPVMGGLSDQAQRWMGTRFPLISGGVILSSALFITIPAVVIFGNPIGAVRWILPIVLIAWALAMAVFRSPAVSLLGRYAKPAALPQAASLLTLTGGLIGAFRPFANKLVLGWGPAVTFAIGSFVLLGSVGVLRLVHPPETPLSSTESPDSSPSLRASGYSLVAALGLIFLTAASLAWGSSFLMAILQKVVKTQLSAVNIGLAMFVIAIALALAALPAGIIAVKLGNQRAMLYGVGATIGLMILIALTPIWAILVVMVIALVAALSLIVNGAVPYALSLVPPQRSGLGTGMYFGGTAAASSLFGMVFTRPSQITPVTGILLGAIAFLVAGLCIAISKKLQLATNN